MVAELVETSRLWGASPPALSQNGGTGSPAPESNVHIANRTGSGRKGAVMATEKVTNYGLPIVAARKVNYSQIRPGVVSRVVHPPCAGGGGLAKPVTPSSVRI